MSALSSTVSVSRPVRANHDIEPAWGTVQRPSSCRIAAGGDGQTAYGRTSNLWLLVLRVMCAMGFWRRFSVDRNS